MNKLLVGRYELLQRVGEGGMAVVYKAKDRLLNRYVAVKILRPEFVRDEQFVENFKKESQAAAGLQHPNIVSVYDVGREGKLHFIVMEYIDGESLSDLIKEEAPMDYRQVIRIAKQVASALSVAHSNDIIHRDIKPHNIMITKDGLVKLGDFGIAKAMSEATIIETSRVIGSVHYFSPEQARGAYVDERSDIYSLGIVMYEMLTGEVPFDGENPVQVALMHINNDIVPPSQIVPGIPPSLEKIVTKAADRYQSNRYRNADELLEDLENVDFVSKRVRNNIYAPEETRKNQAPKPAGEEEDFNEKPSYSKPRKQKKSKKKSKSSGNGKKIAGIALLIAAVVIAGVFGLSKLKSMDSIVVPDVTGLSYANAKARLTDKGLRVEKGDDVASDEFEEGKVVTQDPEGGDKAKKGSTVVICLSSGEENGNVPDLVGRYYDDNLKDFLSEKGFVVGRVTYEKSDDYEEKQIIRQSPAPGAAVKKGSSIDLVVCNGKKTKKSKVPSLTGLSVSDAKKRIREAGFSVGSVTYEESKVYGDGYVMWQEYDPGTSLEEGHSISITVSKGTKPTEVDHEGPTAGGNKDDGNSGNVTPEPNDSQNNNQDQQTSSDKS